MNEKPDSAVDQGWFKEQLDQLGIRTRTLLSLTIAKESLAELVNRWEAISACGASALFVSAVIHYAKPFKKSNSGGGRPRWSYDVNNLRDLPKFDLELHNELVHIRDTMVAHSDSDVYPGSISPTLATFSGSNGPLKVVAELLLKSPALIGIHHKVYAATILKQVEAICEFVANDARVRHESVHQAALHNIDVFEKFLKKDGRVHSQFSGSATLNGEQPTQVSAPVVPLPAPEMSSGVYRYRYREQHMRSLATGGFGAVNAEGRHEIYLNESISPNEAWSIRHFGVGYDPGLGEN